MTSPAAGLPLTVQDVRTLTLKSLRSQIGIVQQDVYLFCGTVKENIAYGKPGGHHGRNHRSSQKSQYS